MKPLTSLTLLLITTLWILGCRQSPLEVAKEPENFGSAIQFNLPTGLATDAIGNLYLFDSGTHQILKLDARGNLLASWGGQGTAPGQFNCYADNGTICGLTLDQQGNLFVVDKGNYRIQKFDRRGNFVTAWGSYGQGDGQFIRPIYVAVGPQGHVYVTDDRRPVIQKFDNNGRFLTKWGSLGSGEGQFRHATGLAVDPDGAVYVSDYENARIQKFDRDGRFLQAWQTGTDLGRAGITEAIAVGPQDRLYVADSRQRRIELFDRDGQPLMA